MKRVLLVVLVVAAAGCSSLPGQQPDSPTQSTDAGSPNTAGSSGVPSTGVPRADSGTDTTTPSPRPTETPPTTVARTTATSTPPLNVQPADNPWGKDTVTVALVAGGHDEIDYQRTLSNALDYWNNHTQYGEYTVRFVTVRDIDQADIRVEIRESIDSCGVEHTDIARCTVSKLAQTYRTAFT
ncbi:MAG: hypothetical protein ABEI77_06920, partial [Halorientalis sp.]